MLKSLRGHIGDIYAVTAFDEWVISAGYDKKIRIWNIETGALSHALGGHTSIVKALCICYSEKHKPKIISGSWDCSVRVWSLETGACLHVLKGHLNRVKAVAVMDAKEQLVVSGSEDLTVRLWNINSGTALHTFEGHTESITSLFCTSIPMSYIASASSDCTIRLWDPYRHHCLDTFTDRAAITCVITTATSNALVSNNAEYYLVAGTMDHAVLIWNLVSKQLLYRLLHHEKPISALGIWSSRCASPGSKASTTIISSSHDGALKIWSLSGELLASEHIHNHSLLCCWLHERDKETLLICGGTDGFLQSRRLEDVFLPADVAGFGMEAVPLQMRKRSRLPELKKSPTAPQPLLTSNNTKSSAAISIAIPVGIKSTLHTASATALSSRRSNETPTTTESETNAVVSTATNTTVTSDPTPSRNDTKTPHYLTSLPATNSSNIYYRSKTRSKQTTRRKLAPVLPKVNIKREFIPYVSQYEEPVKMTGRLAIDAKK